MIFAAPKLFDQPAPRYARRIIDTSPTTLSLLKPIISSHQMVNPLLQVPTRSVVQIRTHAQKYFQKLAREEGLDKAELVFRCVLGTGGVASHTRLDA